MDSLLPPEGPLGMTIGTDGDETVVHLVGELDFNSAGPVLDRLAELVEGGAATIVLDLGALTFCDSAGCSVFLRSHRAAQTLGARLVLRNPLKNVELVLRTLSFDQLLEIET